MTSYLPIWRFFSVLR